MTELRPWHGGSRYRRCRSAESVPLGLDSGPSPETPGEVRRALLPEEAGQFDSEWRTAMSASAETLDLTEVYRVLARWRRIAAMTQADPDGHRRMLDRVDRVLAGDRRASMTADEVQTMIARRPGRRE